MEKQGCSGDGTIKSYLNPYGKKQLTLPKSKKTPYELWRGKKPVVKYFRIFGSDCYILRDRENLEKFDAKSDKGYFLGYSFTSRAYRVYNLRTKTVMESSNVVINDEVCSEAQSKNIAPV